MLQFGALVKTPYNLLLYLSMLIIILIQFPTLNLNTTTPPTSWVIEVYLDNGTFIQNETVSDPNITNTTLMSLIPGTEYEVQVAGINTRGVGNFSDMVSQQTYRG